ncbi:gastrula zinc finger protein XlCGF53.1-like [Ranitomeya imitator]|uniref:gastrula zinc finger protein XlCGF53.1-like n=1 Tax=Ranitomeya imitator TaxID=111125 RepID=UPI0037E7C39D
MDRDKMVERILHLTLEILFRLTGEEYTVVRKTSSECCQDPVSEGWGRPLSSITGPPPHPMIHEDLNDQKILELTYKMTELLTGEVPIRCQDVAVYFSMEEWEYLEGHRDLYKDVMMEVPQPLTSPDLYSKRTTPERCPRPLLPQECKQEDPNVPQDHQGEVLTYINTTGTYVKGDEWCKEEIPTYDYPAPTREMSIETKERIIKLLKEGKSSRNVAKDVGCSQSAVSKIWAKYKQHGKVVKGKHTGRPRKTSKHQDQKLEAICLQNSLQNSKCTTKQMRNEWEETGVNVCDRTVRNRLKEMGIYIQKS